MAPKEDKKWLDEAMSKHLPRSADADAKATAEAVRKLYSSAIAEAARRFTGTRQGLPCCRFLCEAADAAVVRVVAHLSDAGGSVCWIAAGGYGRGYLSPGSTVRLVLLADDGARETVQAAAEETRALLHRALPRSLVVAYTVSEALQVMRRDPITAVALLETRMLGGAKRTHAAWLKALTGDFLCADWGTFGEKALAETLARRDPHTSSPYSAELNLKESAGALRDIGTLQKLTDALLRVQALDGLWAGLGSQETGLLLPAEERSLKKALDFLLAVRNQLHFAFSGETDVLELRAQPAVAERLGYGERGRADGAVAAMMRDVFANTGHVTRLLRTAHERFVHVRAVAWERPHLLPRRELEDGFVKVEGKIYNACGAFTGDDAALRMMKAFLLSQRRHLPVSQHLLDEISESAGPLPASFRSDGRIAALFLSLLGGSVGVAERLGWMRDCGLLQQYIPEFAPLVNLVSCKESYDYTLDEHTLEAVRVIDDLGHTREEQELPQREALSQVERPDLLRLAVLLHHTSSAEAGGDKKAVRSVCERMGLSGADVELACFLVANQDLLKNIAERRDFEDESAIRRAASSIGSSERLRKLYLLTYADSRAAGRLGWFAWRDAVLYEVYQRVMAAIVPGLEALATPEHFRSCLLELAAEENLRDAAEQFCSIIPERYAVEVSPQEALEHLKLIKRLKSAPAAMSVSMEGRCARVWFCTSDVPARFSQIAGVLTANGLNILAAHAFTLTDGTVLDRFIAHRKGRPVGDEPAFWQQVEQTLVGSVTGKLDLDALIAERLAKEPPEAAPEARRGVTSVHFDNDSSSRYTLLDLVTWDRMGLLYSVGRTLGKVGANIEFAMASTRLDLVEDVFYINDSKTGQKIKSETRLAEISKALLAAVSA